MINRYFYQSDVMSFIAEDTDAIFGKKQESNESYARSFPNPKTIAEIFHLA